MAIIYFIVGFVHLDTPFRSPMQSLSVASQAEPEQGDVVAEPDVPGEDLGEDRAENSNF